MPSPIPAPPPYANATRAGIVSATTQTLGGEKTFVDQVTVSSGVKFGDNTVQLTAATPGASVTFNAPISGTVNPGDFVIINTSGQVEQADATVAGKYPAIGICTAAGGGNADVLTVGPASVLSGLTPGVIYFLGATGGLSTVPPPGAFVSQVVIQAYTATAGVLLLTSPIIYL